MKELISEHPRNAKFVKRGKLLRFADLPQTAQDALIHYMSVDGAAWAVAEGWCDWKWGEGQPSTEDGRAEVLEDIAKFRNRFIEQFGDQKFGYVEVSYEELLEAVMGDEAFSGDYKFDYSGGSPKYGNWEYTVPTWPVILSNFHDETLQDGWNRFSVYCKLQMNVPVVWYPD